MDGDKAGGAAAYGDMLNDVKASIMHVAKVRRCRLTIKLTPPR